MKVQFDLKQFIVSGTFQVLEQNEAEPDESIQQLASRITQDAATCDFLFINDPLDEALRTRFICSVNIEVVRKLCSRAKPRN